MPLNIINKGTKRKEVLKMGMASSQVRLLQLIGRKNDIGNQLQHLSLQKTSLTRDMRQISRLYQEAVNSKVYKWSNNAGITTQDLKYDTLMRPNVANKQNTYLITNHDGKIVLDDKYEKYAKIISPNGSAGGNWEANRTQILSELTGIPAEQIDSFSNNQANTDIAVDNLNSLREQGDKILSSEPTIVLSDRQLFDKLNIVSSTGGAKNLGNLYKTSGKIELGTGAAAVTNLSATFNQIAQQVSDLLLPEHSKAFQDACNTYVTDNSHYISGGSKKDEDGLASGVSGIEKDGIFYTVNMGVALKQVLGAYKEATKECSEIAFGNNKLGQEVFYTRDIKSKEWQDWNASRKAWQKEYSDAEMSLGTAVDNTNKTFTADQEFQLKFYDRLFTSIVDNGWECNSQISNPTFLNNMLQNNQFFITTMDEQMGEDGKMDYEYNANLASNSKNIVSVNDTDFQNRALAEYENQKDIINDKETVIDVRMKNLETEQSAILKMIEGVEKQKNDNAERMFNIFG